MRPLLALTVCGALALAAPAALAADPQATKLFQQGNKLFERGETKAACEKFEQSYDIDPAPGTLGNLATCLETLGEYSRAHKAFVELAKRARDAGKTDRADVYRDRAVALEPKLPKIVLGGPNVGAWKELKVDEVDVPREKWSTPIPVEEGGHKIRVASGETTRTLAVTAPHDGNVMVDLPPLDGAAPAAPAAAPPAPAAAPSTAPATPPPPSDSAKSKGVPMWTYVLVGGGAVGLVVGSVAGLKAISRRNDATDACPGHACASADAAARANDARDASGSAATVSTIGFAAGLALVGGGVAVYLLSGHDGVSVSPTVGAGAAGGSLSVRF